MYLDYRTVAGVLYPPSFVERNIATGRVMNTLELKTIEANVAIADSQFNSRVGKKSG